MVRGLIKTVLIWVLVLACITEYLAVMVYALFKPRKSLFRRMRITSRYTRAALKVLGVTVTRHGAPPPANTPLLIASNHLGYLDIFVLSATFPALFITSVELGSLPFIGFMARCAGCVFVERRRRSGIRAEIREISSLVSRGFPVVLFPEGTSSCGDCVTTFKPTLLETTFHCSCTLLPVCIRYVRLNGRPVTPHNRDHIHYYGPLKIFPHMLRLPFAGTIEVDLQTLAPLTPHAYKDRKELAMELHSRISTAFENRRQA